ncbi:hypothetical protein PG999_002040 [Apiospora kogelbergensis]|uniref:Uncharacterized protein n=1 Tax=Apiospora kogelbergensis TaxID=1337665 RepID=A0AAW0R785_9PEZI
MRVSLAILSVFIGFLQLAVGLITASPATVAATASLANAMALPSVSTTLTGILTAPGRPTDAPNPTPHSFSIVGMSALYGSGSVSVAEPTAPAKASENVGQKGMPLSHRWLYAGNDPNYIPAICIRERRKPTSLDVLVAVNKGHADDGNDMLRELENGFNKLFEVLSRACDVDATHLEREAFAVIVSLCSSRILRRLRFEKSPSRPSVKKVLQDALYALQDLGLSSVHPLFINKAKEVVKLLDIYSKHQTQYELKALIEGFHRFQQSQDISTALDAIPNRLMNPDSRANLLNIVRKVSRYRESARFICRMAKRCPLLRGMKVVQVQLGRKAFRRAPVEHIQPHLNSKTPKATPKNDNPYKVKNICRLLGTTIPAADRVFAEQTRKTLKEGKVHAEIQLLFHLSTTTLCSQGTNRGTTAQEIKKASSHQSLSEVAVRDFGIEKLTNTLEPCDSSNGSGSNNGKLATVVEETETATYPGALHEKDLGHVASAASSLSELLSGITTPEEGNPVLNRDRLPEMVCANRASPFYSDGVLEVHVEYSAGTTTPGGLPKQLPFSIEWLEADEADKVCASQSQSTFDAESAEAEVSLNLNDQNSVFISARGSLVKVTFGLPMIAGREMCSAVAEDNHSQ